MVIPYHKFFSMNSLDISKEPNVLGSFKNFYRYENNDSMEMDYDPSQYNEEEDIDSIDPEYLLCTKRQFLNLSAHIGHKKTKWVHRMSLYIYAVRNDIVIFNIDYIQLSYNRAMLFMQTVFMYGGRFFCLSNFVNVGFRGLSEYFLKKMGFGFYDGRFLGGLVSNFFKIIRNYNN